MHVINIIINHEVPKAHYHNSNTLPKWKRKVWGSMKISIQFLKTFWEATENRWPVTLGLD